MTPADTETNWQGKKGEGKDRGQVYTWTLHMKLSIYTEIAVESLTEFLSFFRLESDTVFNRNVIA